METILYDVFVVWMMSAVALGVGASSLAISSFLVALNDGVVDQSEQRMLKVIYWALRSVMVMIPLTVLVVTTLKPGVLEGIAFIWIIIAVLYLNALQMTFHWVPGIIGPALQAASWYTLGFLALCLGVDAPQAPAARFMAFGVYLMVVPTYYILATNTTPPHYQAKRYTTVPA